MGYLSERTITWRGQRYQIDVRGIPHRVVGPLTNSDVVTTNTFFIGVYPGLTAEMIQHVLGTVDRFIAAKGA